MIASKQKDDDISSSSSDEELPHFRNPTYSDDDDISLLPHPEPNSISEVILKL